MTINPILILTLAQQFDAQFNRFIVNPNVLKVYTSFAAELTYFHGQMLWVIWRTSWDQDPNRESLVLNSCFMVWSCDVKLNRTRGVSSPPRLKEQKVCGCADGSWSVLDQTASLPTGGSRAGHNHRLCRLSVRWTGNPTETALMTCSLQTCAGRLSLSVCLCWTLKLCEGPQSCFSQDSVPGFLQL